MPTLVLQQTLSHNDFPRHLFADSRMNAYAVLDGAANPALLDHLYADGERPEFSCLYRGELEPDMAECAPYLARLEQGKSFADWLITNCSGNHWGIFALSRISLNEMLQHLRRHTMVYNQDKQPRLFRFYDPRVLRWFLRTSDAKQLAGIFGPIEVFFAEAEDQESHIRFEINKS